MSSTTDKPSADAARNKVTKLALVIGNGAYRSASPLANPPHDAKLIAGQLRGIGFEAIEGIDLDRDSMRKQLAAFLAKAPTAQIALVFLRDTDCRSTAITIWCRWMRVSMATGNLQTN